MFDVCTYNAGNATPEKVNRDFVQLTRAYPIVGCQEVADRHRILNATGAHVLTGDGRGMGRVALLLGSSVTAKSTGWVPCTPATRVGAWGAGPSVIAPKGIRWALVTVDSIDVTVGVTHLVPSVQRKASTPAAKIGLARRRALFKRHIRAIVKWVNSTTGPLVLMADWNATPDFPLLQPLRDAGLECSSAPSHGKRAIDQLWSRDLTFNHVAALKGFSSDHKPVVANYQAKGTPPMPTKIPPPFERVTFRGRTMDNKTMYGLMVAERRLGYELTVTQGCYNAGGVSASAGTHDAGGVVDLAPWDWENKVKVLRDLGWAAWHRTPAEGPWVEHIHAVMIDQGNLAPAAAAQVADYRNGLNGLANHAADSFPYRPDPIPVFNYPAAVRDEGIRTRIQVMQERIKAIRLRITEARKKITYH